METLSTSGQQAIDELARRHGFSADAVASMFTSVRHGNGSMAQFNHPEFSGSGQWMRGGMTMVSDMFNDQLKGRVSALCADLAQLLASQDSALLPARSESIGAGSQGRSGSFSEGTSLFVPPPEPSRRDWWPAELQSPSSTGAQNDVRYAYFPAQRRLAIDVRGRVTVYDTLDHQIGGVSQQQSHGASLNFTSQHGLIDVARLPVVSGGG